MYRKGIGNSFGGVSGNHQGLKNSVSQVDGVSDLCLLAGSVGVGLRKGTVASASTFVWEKAAPPALVLMPGN